MSGATRTFYLDDEWIQPAEAEAQAQAVVIQGSLSTKRLADLALQHRLPAASTTRAFVDAGGLMSYGADGLALFRLSAKFVHRILQGGQPNDLPIEAQRNSVSLARARW